MEKEEKEKKEEKESDGKGNNSSVIWFVGIAAVVVIALIYYFIGYKGITGNVISEQGDIKIIKVGFMGPLTGDASSYGESIKRGVDLALKDSGLENVEIIYEDTKCDGKEAVSAINKLINVNGVSAIVGEVCSGATLAAAPIAEENKIVMISASSTSPEITKSGDYIFRTVPSDSLQGSFGANLAYNKGYRKLAILHSNEEYGVGFRDVLKDKFSELGGQVVISEAFERGSTDLRTQLTKIKNSNPEVIYIISNSPDSAVAALKQIKELGIKSALFGSEGLKGPEVQELGEPADGLIITSVSSGSTGFNENHKKEYGTEPGPFAAQGYDAFSVIALALKKNVLDKEAMRDYAYDAQFGGASGRIAFDSNGDIFSSNYELYEVRNKTFVSLI
ncbi:MAG: penicillin-binding protein activator [Nanoarchaeota archaeon]